MCPPAPALPREPRQFERHWSIIPLPNLARLLARATSKLRRDSQSRRLPNDVPSHKHAMPLPTDPAQVDHPALRELALRAAWVARLEEAIEVHEDPVVDLSDGDEDQAEPDHSDESPLVVTLSVV